MAYLMLLLNGTPNIPDGWSVAEVSYRAPRGIIELPTKTLKKMGYVRIHWRGGERGGHSTVPLSPPSFVAGFFLNFSHQVARDTFADGGDPYWVTDGAEGTSAVVIFFSPSETCLSFSRFLSLECASVR